MTDIRIHQIYYSEETFASKDTGFIGLDNRRNERPDWREYWPIRNFLLGIRLEESAFYGFFSPKFAPKTGLDSAAVIAFIKSEAESADVVLFSPFFDQIAYPINMFEQGAMQHPDTLETFRESALLAEPSTDFNALVMDSTNSVFCNYFVARPAFWREWLEKCERIFEVAERAQGGLARRLNEDTSHDGGGVPTKVFVIERMASLMLATQKRWRVKAYNPLSLPWSASPLAQFRLEMTFLDALKVSYASQGHPEYLTAFHQLRGVIAQWMKPPIKP